MSSAGASPGGTAVSIGGERIFLFRPAELDRAKAGNFADVIPRTLTAVNTKEAADQLVREGWVTFTSVVQYDTQTTGLSQLPRGEADGPKRKKGGWF